MWHRWKFLDSELVEGYKIRKLRTDTRKNLTEGWRWTYNFKWENKGKGE